MPIADNNTLLLMRESDRHLPFEIDGAISMPGFSTAKDSVVSNEQTLKLKNFYRIKLRKPLQSWTPQNQSKTKNVPVILRT